MSRTERLSRGEAQRRVKAALRAVIPVDVGGPGSERVADWYGCAATAVREWANDEAQKNAPLAILLQLDAATYRAVLDEIDALRAEVYGPPLAPASVESSALVSVSAGGSASAAVAGALADNGRIDAHEIPDVTAAVRRSVAADTAFLHQLARAR